MAHLGRLRSAIAWKHAVTEILLIVVGVLLALAVNDWNAERQKRTLEVAVLRQLRISLATDLAGLEERGRAVRLREDRIATLRTHLDSQLPYADSLRASFGAAIRFWDVPLNRSPYEALKAKGLDLISHDSLRLRVVALFDHVYADLEHSEADDRSAVLDVVRPYYLSHFRDIQFGDSATPLNYSFVAQDPYFRNLLDYRLFSLRINTSGPTQVAIHDVSGLIQLIDSVVGRAK